MYSLPDEEREKLQEEMRQRKIQKYREIVADIPSLKIISFDVDTSWVGQLMYVEVAPIDRVSLIDRRNTNEQEQTQWIIDVLKQHNIQGEWLFGFAGLPFAKVDLSDGYEWVNTIWSIQHSMRFIPLDHTFWFMFKWSESCFGGNCYVANMMKNTTKESD